MRRWQLLFLILFGAVLGACDDLEYTDPGTSIGAAVACSPVEGTDVACRTEPEVRIRSPRAASSTAVEDDAVSVDPEWAVLATLGGRASVYFSDDAACSLAQDETDEQARLVVRSAEGITSRLTAGVALCTTSEPITVMCDATEVEVDADSRFRLACNTDVLERYSVREGGLTVDDEDGPVRLEAGQMLVRIPDEGSGTATFDDAEVAIFDELAASMS